ncbi:helicase [Nocardioides phosphati]|uniref:Helicase n=1 Tax=Nocardioides phosphati TaxID=1867775 RepID=A0ABQ2NFL7_9ACTN|nr:type ISP restriction/modification enzyme [Nocardioides phosphati]GGO94055.1 helicase [Nocardioides phosphati]
MATIHEVLAQLRTTALDERDKGDKFERLIRAYLTTEPEWTAKFSDVWLWSEWPGRVGRPDTGIDMVAAHRDRDDLAAIQCKFYDEHKHVAKADIDSFVASSGKAEFSARYIFDTAGGWSKNATDALEGLAVPVQRVDIGYLDDARVDWSQFSWSTPEVVVASGPKTLRPHQTVALEKVRAGLGEYDRGKLIMACGTGKTFTSLKIAEELVGAGGSVLFLVPSIQLLSQSLREWMAQADVDIRPFAVCSDVRVGRKTTDDPEFSTIELTEPATTDAVTLAARMTAGKRAKERMTVVFATYQSIDVVAAAQQAGVGDFDLIICDEAHRTTGVTLAGGDESSFVRVHDNNVIKARKRLYMTATPRVFGDEVKRRATDAEAILADMGDEETYGPELHRLGFGDAVEAGLLTDYKVLVLAVEEQYVAENFQQAMANSGEIALGDAAKLLGCWNGLAKNYGSADLASDNRIPMRRAVAFAKDIRASKQAAASFPVLVDRALQEEMPSNALPLRVETRHVDGTMGIHERNSHLAWVKEDAPDDVCRILTNARCLSEGVDVPALDAVLFLTPRGSQVDVVQSVGRVMRKAPGKELGYIILPVVVPAGMAPEDALRDNERYRVVWQVLQALRSHDDRFHAMINQIELNKTRNERLIIDNVTPRDEDERNGGGEGPSDQYGDNLELTFAFDGFRDAMYARIVQKVGERRYWETWAKDVSEIADRHKVRIRALLANPDSPQSKEFAQFLKGLRANLNDGISVDDAIEMLAQHLVTRPIFDALFGHSGFVSTNPVARIMELMLASLDEVDMSAERENLEPFYASVRRRVSGVDNAEGKQRILVELYDKFFATAFKKTVDKLGIVYTPIEIVDFILRSADAVMRQEFGRGLTDEGVHVLDGFTGTGTFLVRLLQSGLIEPQDVARKYASEMAGQEILLLAYYIAAANLQMVYEDLTGESRPFPHLALADTFQAAEDDDQRDLDVFTENNDVLEAIEAMKIDVIVGNPPYSAGQDSANDNNANEVYPTLDGAIRRDYLSERSRGGNNAMFDSYIRAIRWATSKLGERGVIAFITNGGFLDSNTADGMRKSLAAEFSSIHIYNLRGNGRVGGEEGRREGRPLFEFAGWGVDGKELKSSKGGSRATIAITVLVRNPEAATRRLRYRQVADYLTAGQKIREVEAAGDIVQADCVELVPNEHGDWLDQRDTSFQRHMPVGAKHGADLGAPTIFETYTRGLETGRDAWVYNSSRSSLEDSVRRTIGAFNDQVRGFQEHRERTRTTAKPKDLVPDFIDLDPTKISWTLSLKNRLAAGRNVTFEREHLGGAIYRPFFRQTVYYDGGLNHIRGQLPRIFPTTTMRNFGFYLTAAGSGHPFSALACDLIPDLALWGSGSGQYFPRWRYEQVEEDAAGLELGLDIEGGLIDGHRQIDNVTDEALANFVAAYPAEAITKDDIYFYVYGLLHSPTYRVTFASDLRKMLPRIPFVRNFRGFVDAGRSLSDLHLGYETVDPYPLAGLDIQPIGDPYAFFAVGDRKMAFGKSGKEKDRTTIVYNDRITLSGIPEEAYQYMLGSRSAIEWIIDRYYVKTDKASGIVNDPNDWSREVGDPRYIIDLLARVVTVSVETMKIVDSLPPLEVIPEA